MRPRRTRPRPALGVRRAPRFLGRWQALIPLFLSVVLAGWGTGCVKLRFYAQAIHGQAQMFHRQRPMAKLLADTNTPAALAARLRLALVIRDFAETNLHLPANGHYRSYADLGRPFAVWNVYAAPEFSLEARSWWYPVVGRLKYQGYFHEAQARRLAAQLALRGNDVYIGGVEAYSTLGWFRDPVLNTFVFSDDLDLAELLFHELAHQRLFVRGDTDFNEAFATAVAEEGVRRWLQARGARADLVKYEGRLSRKEQFVALLTQSRERLAALYASAPPATPAAQAERRAAKAAVFQHLREDYAALKATWDGRADYDVWFSQPLNNARLNTVETYYGLVPGFRQLLAEHGGRLPDFYRAAERLGRLDAETRRHRLRPPPPAPRRSVTPPTQSDSETGASPAGCPPSASAQ